jgi:hypothetical protein
MLSLIPFYVTYPDCVITSIFLGNIALIDTVTSLDSIEVVINYDFSDENNFQSVQWFMMSKAYHERCREEALEWLKMFEEQ